MSWNSDGSRPAIRLFSHTVSNLKTTEHFSIEHVNSGQYSHVVVADIADFYPRLYSHRVENELRTATTRVNHAVAVKNLIQAWNEHISFGIPVGTDASRLIAEIAIDDIDKTLRSEGVKYVRYVDDYRMFARSALKAHQQLANLATALFENHDLTLQQHKTRIMTLDEFERLHLTTPTTTELNSLAEKFHEIIESLGLDNPYVDIAYDDLEPGAQNLVDSLNLEEMLAEQLKLEEINIPIVKFLLRRLDQVDITNCVHMLITGIQDLYPVFPDVIKYFRRLRSIARGQRETIGKQILELLDTSIVSHLEFHRMWLLGLFTNGSTWGNGDQFVPLYGKYDDLFSKRKLVLALGQSGHDCWFRSRKRNVFDFRPWLRRALLAGGSCLPTDEMRHWYQGLESRLDPLELAVTLWARDNRYPH